MGGGGGGGEIRGGCKRGGRKKEVSVEWCRSVILLPHVSGFCSVSGTLKM